MLPYFSLGTCGITRTFGGVCLIARKNICFSCQVIGFIKGKSAIWIAWLFGRQRNFTGQNFWARGYCVSTAGMDEAIIKEYIKIQEEED
jgi:REP element-mobilizing transposase RayT